MRGISYALYALEVFAFKREMPMRTCIDQFLDICCSPLMDTCPCFLVDSVIWYPQCLAAVSVIWKKGKCLCSCPRNAFTPLLCYQHLMAVFSRWLALGLCPSGWTLLTGPGVLPSRPNASLVCSYNSPLKTLVLSLVKEGVDFGVTSRLELICGLALNSGGFCGQVSAEAGLITKNL